MRVEKKIHQPEADFVEAKTITVVITGDNHVAISSTYGRGQRIVLDTERARELGAILVSLPI